jgi:hypothetical protein
MRAGAHAYVADDPSQCIVLDCAHEQKHIGLQWVESIGVANKDAVFAMLVGLTKQF